MEAILTEQIVYTFGVEDQEKIDRFKAKHLTDGFSVIENTPPSEQVNGSITLKKETHFPTKK